MVAALIVNFTDLVTYTGVKQNALVVVVLPASMSGDTDITITLNGVVRAIVIPSYWGACPQILKVRRVAKTLRKRIPAEVSEGLVRFSHTVNVFTFLDRRTLIVSGIQQLAKKR